VVYGPDGYSINSASTIAYDEVGQPASSGAFAIDPLQFLNDGQYLLGVRRIDLTGEGLTGVSIAYTVTLGMTQTPLLTTGVEVTGKIDGVEVSEHTYRFEASAGQTVRITVRSLNTSYAPGVDLQGPAFETTNVGILNVYAAAPGAFSYEVALQYDGVYLLRVRNAIYYTATPEDAQYSLLLEVVE
jgi:hypothetical protein